MMYLNRRNQFLSALTLTAVMALTAAGTVFAAPAPPDNFVFTGPSADTEVVTVDVGNLDVSNGYAGVYLATLNGQPINIFCVDPDHEITDGQEYEADYSNLSTAAPASSSTPGSGGYYTGGLGSEMNSTDADPNQTTPLTTAFEQDSEDEITYLADQYLDPTSNTFSSIDSDSTAVNEAAVNVAIWDIVENGGSPDLSGSDFSMGSTALDDEYATLTNDFLSMASGEINYTSPNTYWIQAPNQQSGSHGQNYIYDPPATPTPEVSPAAVLGLGFGGILLALGIRAKRSALKA